MEREREQQGEGASQRADEERHKAALQLQANDLRIQVILPHATKITGMQSSVNGNNRSSELSYRTSV